jgi:GAF domain-containing protein
MIDDNEFFRNATLRICGNLKIEAGLKACFEYISQHIPADRIYLERHEYELGAMRIVARADAGVGERINVLTPYDEPAKQAMLEAAEAWRAGTFPSVLVINKSQEEPVTKCLLDALGEPISSVISLPLEIAGQLVGALALIATGDDRFNEDHVRLYSTLKEPFFVAMSNTMEHEEVVRLKNLLVDDNRYLSRELQRVSGD